MSIEDVLATLEERKNRYGSFVRHSEISQKLKEVLFSCDEWHKLSKAQRESLEMICHKIARILNGDPNYSDNWHDIAGYATLIEQEVEKI